MHNILSHEHIKHWLQTSMPSGVYEAAMNLDRVENWVLDASDGTFFPALQKFSQFIADNAEKAGLLIDDPEVIDFVRILAYTHTTQSLRLMNLAGQCQPGLGGDIVTACEKSEKSGNPLEAESKVLLGRIKFLAKLELYRRIFGPEQRRQVLDILRELKEENKQ